MFSNLKNKQPINNQSHIVEGNTLDDMAFLLHLYFKIKVIKIDLIKNRDTIVFKAQSTDNHSYTVKLYKAERSELVSKIFKTKPFLQHLAAHLNATLQTPLGDDIVPMILWQSQHRYLVINNWIEGKNIVQKNHQLMQQLGTLMAKMHNAASDFSSTLPLLLLDEIFFQNIKPVMLNQQERFGFEAKQMHIIFEAIVTFLKNKGKTKTNFGLIHSDLHFGNLLQVQQQLLPIDFDELAYGHFLLDIGVTFNEIDDFDDAVTFKAAFLRAYEAERPISKVEKKEIPHFQVIANCLYLNWLFAPENEELLEDNKMYNYGISTIAHILNFTTL